MKAKNGTSEKNGLKPRITTSRYLIDGEIPSIAFGLPDEAFDIGYLTSIDDQLRRKEAIVEHVLAEMGSRYAPVYEKHKRKLNRSELSLTEIRAEQQGVKEKLNETKSQIPGQTQNLEMPEKWDGAIVLFYIVILLAVATCDWVSAAGFAARSEMGSFPMALAFTFSFAVGAIAIKEFVNSYTGFTRMVIDRIIPIVGLGFFSAFILLYSHTHQTVGLETAVSSIVQDGVENPIRNNSWLLLPLQVGSGLMFGIVLLSALAKKMIVKTPLVENPEFSSLSRKSESLNGQTSELETVCDDATGVLREWADSMKVHVARCEQILAEFEDSRQAWEAQDRHLKNRPKLSTRPSLVRSSFTINSGN